MPTIAIEHGGRDRGNPQPAAGGHATRVRGGGAFGRDRWLGRSHVGAARPPDGGDVGQGTVAQVGRWRRSDGFPDDRRSAAQALQLGGALGAAGDVAGKGRRIGRIACRQAVEAARLDCRDFEELARLSVFHRLPSPILTIAGRNPDRCQFRPRAELLG